MLKKNRVAVALFAALSGFAAVAHADTSSTGNTLADFFMHSKVDGQIRSYYFNRFFGGTQPNARAFSLGGYINVHTPSAAGFSADVGFYTANSLGANPGNQTVNDVTLMGLGDSINALGQAYLQYAIPDVVMIRAGNQEVNTPFVNGSDSRMIPATFQGVFAQVTPYCGWNIYGMRMFRWKSRTSGDYYRDNLYYNTGFDGDPIYGGAADLPAGTPASNGILAFGTSYKRYGINAQAWYYNFYNFTNMFYGDASYTLKTGMGLDPFLGGQVVREWDANSRLNGTNGAGEVDHFKGNSVNSTTWGVEGGVKYNLDNAIFGKGALTAAYNEIEYHPGAIGGGAIVSPYTVGYATDPLYTTSMIRGLVEMGPGHAWKISLSQHFLNNSFLFQTSYAQYQLQANGSANDIYGDLTYFPKGFLKGLSIRDRVGVAHGDLSAAQAGYFIYNRVMLTYAF
ncbi:OprD family outer membrane porin [Acidithiobacillus sulfurivorans]|uniref:OprD family porin n=1 Tax=Acidithiobacillus sulfurivorans TaxID=1958756 RepID=A0ABS6A3H6_9PROT|nr:OprD family outer membrane porin [Acidithiobacillus sulfurivorans]MBU2761449.1 OprD family porin [Acidithiobacillus sulfurivorans]